MLYVNSIYRESIVDGDGLRMAIFLQGCNHKCRGCHNPESWKFNVGNKMNFKDIEKEYNYEQMDGITLSGGDPFFQAKQLKTVCKKFKEKGVNIWAYTGFRFEEFKNFMDGKEHDDRINQDMIDLLGYIDVLVDGPFILEKRCLSEKFKGSTNQRIIDLNETLRKHNGEKIILYKFEE